jgi:hypothetical protein
MVDRLQGRAVAVEEGGTGDERRAERFELGSREGRGSKIFLQYYLPNILTCK